VRWRWRRHWPVAALAGTALAVVVVHIVVDRITREPPNYARVEDGLWLGGYVAEPPPGTRAVLNLCESEDPYRAESHRWEPIRDAEPVPSLDWLREQVRFIEAERAAGRTVYVHCRNGVSRSGMVVVAFYMARNGWSRDEAMEFVRSHRPELRPNPAFMQLLLEWESLLKSKGGQAETSR
jgi:hypothetical protein